MWWRKWTNNYVQEGGKGGDWGGFDGGGVQEGKGREVSVGRQ